MSRHSPKELLPDIKPASQYQFQLKEIERNHKEKIILEQMPIIMNAFKRLEKDITKPVTITLRESLEPSLFQELINKGYRVEQMDRYDFADQHQKIIHNVIISVPFETGSHIGGTSSFGDMISFPFDFSPFSFFRSQYPIMIHPEIPRSNLTIEEIDVPSMKQLPPPMKQLPPPIKQLPPPMEQLKSPMNRLTPRPTKQLPTSSKRRTQQNQKTTNT